MDPMAARKGKPAISMSTGLPARLSPDPDSTPIATGIRRRSSVYETIQDVQSEILAPAAKENVNWNNIPLAMAILPAVSGLFFTNGTHFVADVILLFLAATFLHWLIKFPWDWYHESQNIALDLVQSHAVFSEEDEKGEKSDDSDATLRVGHKKKVNNVSYDATLELERNRRVALLCCFLGPLLGAWLLHAIRSQLSRPGESLLSTFNITVFVLGAEIRPSAHVIKMIRSRTKELQSVKYQPPPSKLTEMSLKVEELSLQVQTLMAAVNTEDEMLGNVKKGIQPDLDALNRAVRRYERKEALQSAQTEERLAYLDRRLNDAFTLAAAAVSSAQDNQNSSLGHILTAWIAWSISIPFVLMIKIISVPIKAIETLATLPLRTQAGRASLGKHRNGTSRMNDPLGKRPKQIGDGKAKHRGKARFA
ncbi:hypothetical protein TWF192_008998 [Orbilia oligospora]|uniref:Uncharacterized protein n=1 Tax=Orbilia oligospora TaxID=2813651 RepID=A0A6G1MLX1_ORBOL|nr:hypothetical protein TWF191_005049 [Orbilia oligospora]KAF3261065.1 hypothetical protein TWF192_008998 [Orbilia oligospora]